ncbi:class I SAM-dependent methyltransferase [Desulfobacterales bacterium HSG16]|nr:class I SAM-dependent methyltransferase [Desulfobacterales bacterium HSG16]
MTKIAKFEKFRESLGQDVNPLICNVCSETLIPCFSRVRDPMTDEFFAIYTCTQCGLGHTIPHPVDLGRYYSKNYYGDRHGITSPHCIRRRLKIVRRTLKNGASGKYLLDVGCGDGSFLLAARNAGWKVMGTELNPQPARAAGLDVKESVEQVDCQGHKFDCIMMWHSLEHMRDIKATIHSLTKLLHPKGRIIIAVPDNGGLQAGLFGPRWLHLDVPRHLYHFDAGSLNFCLEQAGFTTLHRWHQELEYDLIGWSQSALNYLSSTPNVFFDYITGKGKNFSSVQTTYNTILGSVLTLLFIPAVFTGTIVGRGGTLITVAHRTE